MRKETVKKRFRLPGKSRLIFGILLIAWIPWGILCFPGNLPWDAGTSIAWFLGIDRSNVNNPWFQNLLMGLFYKAGELLGNPSAGTYVYCWLQMVLEAWLLGRVIAYLSERTGAGKWAYLLVPFFALLPVFPIYAFMMGKDSSFGLALLTMVYLLIRAAVEGKAFWALRRNVWTLAALPVLLGLLRNFGGVIPLAVFAVLVIRARKKEGILPAAAAALALICCMVLIPGLAGIPGAEIKEEMSMPLQTAAYYVQEHPDDVTEDEWETISRVVDPEILKESYTPAIADPVKDQSYFTAETRSEFLRMLGGMFLKHPGTVLEGWRRSTDLYFSLTQDSQVKSHVFIGVCYSESLRETLGITTWDEGNYYAKGAWHVSMMIPVVRTLQRSGLYSWMTLFLTLAVIVFRQARKFLPCCLLLLMVLGACLLSPVNGYFRYAYPMILSFPAVLAAVLGSIGFRHGRRG